MLYYDHSGEVSGGQISLLLLMQHMTGIELILAAPEGHLLERARRSGIRTIAVRSHRARMTANPFLLSRGVLGTWSAGRELRQVIQRESPDVVHANSIRAGLIAAVAVRGTGARLVWHVRDALSDNVVGRMIRKVAASRADHVIAISKAIQNQFSTSPVLQRKTSVVYNAVDVVAEAHASVRAELGVPEARFVVAVVGQITPWKRHHDAIAAFSRHIRDNPDSELWIVGEPKFRQENLAYDAHLRRQVATLGLADRVRFLGFREDVTRVMADIDVLLVPSENEPFGRVIIEAMSVGKPVIGTRGGGIPEIIIEAETGCLVEIGDVQRMAELLTSMQMNRALRHRLGLCGKRRVTEHFSLRRQIEQVSGIYEALTSQPQRTVTATRQKIIIVANDIGGVGGMEKHLEELIARLKGRYELTVLASTFRIQDQSGVRFIRVPVIRRPFPLMILMFSLYATWRLFWLRRDSIIHTTGAITLNRVDVSTVHFCHAGYLRTVASEARSYDSWLHSMNAFISLRMKLWLERHCYAPDRTHRIVAVSNHIAQEVSTCYNYPAQNINVISNGVDSERFRPASAAEKHRLRVQRQLPSDGTYLIFTGGDWGRKGLRHALEAFNQLGADYPALHVLVVGRGDVERYRRMVHAQYQPRVLFVGQQPDPEVWYRMADIFVFPSTYEACSMAVLEAASSGLAMVVTDVGGAGDIVVNGISGRFIQPDAGSIVRALRDLMDDAEAVAAFGSQARNKVMELSWDAACRHLERVYESLHVHDDTRWEDPLSLPT